MRYRSINIVLRSQFDLSVLPEFRAASVGDGDAGQQHPLPDAHAATSPPTAFVPFVPASQFWICYSIAPPHPPRSYFYFKLFIGGQHIVSWGVGQQEGYRGKTAFAVWDHNHDSSADGTEDLRKHAFFFRPGASVDHEDNSLEIRVHRSYGRKAVPHQGLVQEPPPFVTQPSTANIRYAGEHSSRLASSWQR